MEKLKEYLQKSTFKILGSLALIGFSVGGIYTAQYAIKLPSLVEDYYREVEKYASKTNIVCGESGIALWRWCDEYLQIYSTALFFLDNTDFVEKSCALVRHNGEYYEQELKKFFTRLDQNSSLRESLEEKVYILEDEVSIDVAKKSDGYEVVSYEDESNGLYAFYLKEIWQDPQIQMYLSRILDGNQQAISRLTERAEALLNVYIPLEDLEARVLDNIREKFTSAQFTQDLAELNSTGQDYFDQIQLFNNLVVQSKAALDEKKVLLQQAQHMMARALTLEPDYRRATGLNQKIEDLQETIPYIEQSIVEWQNMMQRATKNKERVKELWNEQKTILVEQMWKNVYESMVKSRITKIIPEQILLNTDILAIGHTHPFFSQQEEEGSPYRPSSADIEFGMSKPDLTFVAFPDRWQIYQNICGESELVREYQRNEKN